MVSLYTISLKRDMKGMSMLLILSADVVFDPFFQAPDVPYLNQITDEQGGKKVGKCWVVSG